MGLFDVLTSSTSIDSTSKPTFDQSIDSTNLQIKSLLYLFKRLRINKLSPIIKDGELRYSDNIIDDECPIYLKLDKTYNKEIFEKEILLNDEYRVIVDYIKNKFRSRCFISGKPDNLSRPGSPIKGQSTTNNDQDYYNEYPIFVDYKDRKIKNYKFIYFPLKDVTIESIANILSTSDLYVEHSVSFLKRYNIALESITKVIKNTKKDVHFDLTIEEKNQIILNYLKSLSFYVQLIRIYEEYTKLHPLVFSLENLMNNISLKSDSISPNQTPSSSPLKHKNSTSYFPYSTSSSSINTSPSKSPPKLAHRKSQNLLRSKPSISKLKMEELYNPVVSPPVVSPSKTNSEITNNQKHNNHNNEENKSGSGTLSEEVEGKEILRLDVYEKCKNAINDKLYNEKQKIRANLAV
ncbi:uncharacterized protein KGF55_000473 [Candida pseudojiufengensis]|uniref:uncharacterized protein n=1 Tax=Candida pseudojiufengensis TaxID=497109 RepID=UPI002223F8EA|nr:uncharacterized protein KGF55_000473 [Candida pseudojiufengensis]KAI5966164.1 hypothetical protein KGF55_000473 [Candida pseudojiufengensis]